MIASMPLMRRGRDEGNLLVGLARCNRLRCHTLEYMKEAESDQLTSQ